MSEPAATAPAREARVLDGTVSEAAEEDGMLGSWSGGSGGTVEGSPVLRFLGPRRTGTEPAVSGKLPDPVTVGGGTVSEAAEEDTMPGSWSGVSGGTEEGSPVLRFLGPRGMELNVASPGCLVGSEEFASCAGAAGRFPVMRFRGPDVAGPRRDAAVWASGARDVMCSCRSATSFASWP